MLQKSYCQTEFSIREARQIVQDLFKPRPAIYWTDLPVEAMGLEAWPAIEWSCCCRCSRSSRSWCSRSHVWLSTAHRCSHTSWCICRGNVRSSAFRVAWNVLVRGVPFLIPSFLYHHARHGHPRSQALRHPRRRRVFAAGEPSAARDSDLSLPAVCDSDPGHRAILDLHTDRLGQSAIPTLRTGANVVDGHGPDVYSSAAVANETVELS